MVCQNGIETKGSALKFLQLTDILFCLVAVFMSTNNLMHLNVAGNGRLGKQFRNRFEQTNN